MCDHQNIMSLKLHSLKKFFCFVVCLGFYIRFVILDVCWSCIGYIRKSPFMGTLFWVAFNFPSRKNDYFNNLYSLDTFSGRCISRPLFCCRILNLTCYQSVKSVNKSLQNVKIYFMFYWCPPCVFSFKIWIYF